MLAAACLEEGTISKVNMPSNLVAWAMLQRNKQDRVMMLQNWVTHIWNSSDSLRPLMLLKVPAAHLKQGEVSWSSDVPHNAGGALNAYIQQGG